MIRINGVDIDKIEISLMQYLEENSISPQRIAVELNEEILPKANYAATVLKDGDVVEFVIFVLSHISITANQRWRIVS